MESPSTTNFPTHVSTQQWVCVGDAEGVQPQEIGWYRHVIGPTAVQLFCEASDGLSDNTLAIDLEQDKLLDQLVRLDELAFAAIFGGAREREQLREAWPRFRRELPASHLDESRAQYVQQLLRHWKHAIDRPSSERGTNGDCNHDTDDRNLTDHVRQLLTLMFD